MPKRRNFDEEWDHAWSAWQDIERRLDAPTVDTPRGAAGGSGLTPAASFANDLKAHGAIVVPVFAPSDCQRWAAEIATAMDEFPEYKVTGGLEVQRVLGGFGALGNPSSFHHPTIRRLRRTLKHKVRPIFKQYILQTYQANARGIRLEMLFDRLCVRHHTFGNVSAESWHRDIYDGKEFKIRELPRTLPPRSRGTESSRDIITGGWVNLSSKDQKFIGILGSHDTPEAHAAQEGAEREGGGFAMLTPKEIVDQDVKGQLQRQASNQFGSCRTDNKGNTVIPPGHMLIFFQRLLHSVAPSKKSAEFSLRFFTGFRLTKELVPLFQETARVIENGEVPRIPSGQMPPMYSGNHYAQFNSNTQNAARKFRNWASNTFVRQVLFQRSTKNGQTYYTPGSPKNRDPSANKGRYMTSLADYGLMTDQFEYSDDDKKIITPELLVNQAPGQT